MLSRKHYKMIAKCIKDNTIKSYKDCNNSYVLGKDRLIDSLSDVLKRDNINFNYTMFRDACE